MTSDLNSSIDYEAVLADLRAKRAQVDAAIVGIEAMLGIKSLAATETATLQPGAPRQEVTAPGAFLGMSIVEATVALLRAKRVNLRTEEILAALKHGGLAFRSESPINTVGSVLNRDWSNGGDVVRVERGIWGLAEWHPRLRKRANGNKVMPDTNLQDSASAEVADDFEDLTTSSPNEPERP